MSIRYEDKRKYPAIPKYILLYSAIVMAEKEVRYIGKVYKMGLNKIVVSVPHEYWPDVDRFIGPKKRVWVSLREAT